MKKNETRDETLERLARDASKGPEATKQFTRLVKVVTRVTRSEVERARQARRELPD
ncbi:MAG: hypothetical protein QOG51_1582 [Verrucomicrobiota bacterium]